MKAKQEHERLLRQEVDVLPRTRKLASISILSGLAIMLHVVPIRIPAPYAPFLIYELWEVPIMASFLLMGPLPGIAVAVINWGALQFIFPGALPVGPVYNLFAVLSMFGGVSALYGVMRGLRMDREAIQVPLATLAGIATRVAFMSLVNFLALPQPYPIGFSIPYEQLPAFLGLIAIFNASVALYTIPLGHTISRLASAAMGVKPWNHIRRASNHLI